VLAISVNRLMLKDGRLNWQLSGSRGAGRGGLDAKVAVPIEGRTVWVIAWLYVVEGHMGGRQPVLLLDTDLNENHPDDRQITHYLIWWRCCLSAETRNHTWDWWR